MASLESATILRMQRNGDERYEPIRQIRKCLTEIELEIYGDNCGVKIGAYVETITENLALIYTRNMPGAR